jgi:hypothetical protein
VRPRTTIGTRKYGGLMPSEMKRLRQLEEENGKLKKIVADLSLYKEMLQDGSAESFEAYPEEATGRMRYGIFRTIE